MGAELGGGERLMEMTIRGLFIGTMLRFISCMSPLSPSSPIMILKFSCSWSMIRERRRADEIVSWLMVPNRSWVSST